jgi:hypothetical protein
MRLLPEDFLNQLARDYDLSSEQKEVFVRRFSSKENELDAANFSTFLQKLSALA